jgi:hypothetical protein
MHFLLVEKLFARLQETRKPLEQSLCAGGFTKMEDYKFTAGKLAGLLLAESVIPAVYRELYEPRERETTDERTDSHY